MLTQRGAVVPGAPQDAEAFLAEALAAWCVRSALVAVGLRGALASLREPGEVVLEYDPDLRLLSAELWVRGSRVFGLDDLV